MIDLRWRYVLFLSWYYPTRFGVDIDDRGDSSEVRAGSADRFDNSLKSYVIGSNHIKKACFIFFDDIDAVSGMSNATSKENSGREPPEKSARRSNEERDQLDRLVVMGNSISMMSSGTRRPPRVSAGGGGDTTGVSVTGAGETGADGVTGVTGTTGTTTLAKNNWAAADTKATTGSGVDGTTGNAEGGKAATKSESEEAAEEPFLDQCGFDANTDFSRECPLEPRIKESRLTPEEKAKFRGHLDKIFHVVALRGRRVLFYPNEVIEVMQKVIPYLNSEPMLIEDVPFDISIVGDLHGQLHDLHRVFVDDEKDGKPGWENMKYLFLGDYVDRGRQSLEVVMALFCLKMLYPDRIFLLRGNHEYVRVNARYGLPLELYDRFEEKTWRIIYYKMNQAFCYLSAAAIVGNIYFCSHAGISLSNFTRRHMVAIRKPIHDSRQDTIVHDLTWSDPAKGLRGSCFNTGRETSMYFGLDELALALDSVDCIGLFRGHTMIVEGYEFIGNLCVNLFTATGTSEEMNDGSVGVIDEHGKLTVRILECNKERVLWDCKMKRKDGSVADLPLKDEITVHGDDDTGTGKTANMQQQ